LIRAEEWGGAIEEQTWSTWSALQGWETEGIWRENSDGYDVTVVERNHLKHISIVGDKFGIIRVYESPILGLHPPYVKSMMHSGKIAGIKFSNKGDFHEETYVFSIGREDLALVQYRMTAYESDDICKLAIKSEHMLGKRNIFSTKNTKKGMLKYQSNRHYRSDIPNLWPKEYTGDTLREIYQIGNKMPDTDFIVRDSIGVETNKMIQGVKYSGKDMVVYVSGNTIVTYCLSRKQKSFFIYHKKKISAINVLFAPPHDKTSIVASAETLDDPGETAKIIVWLSSSKEILAEISHLRGYIIEKIIFHPDGERLIAISYNGSYYRISVYQWKKGKLLSSENLGKCKINDIKFKDSTECITVGIRHLRWFDFHGTYMVSSKADWGEFPGEDLTSCEYCFSKQI
jgi:WD40 repeat protein